MCFELPALDELHRKMSVSIGEKLVDAGVVKAATNMENLYKVSTLNISHNVHLHTT